MDSPVGQSHHLSTPNQPRLSFVAVFETPHSFPVSIDFMTVPGLCRVDLLARVESRRMLGQTQGIYTVWESEGHFKASEASFLAQLHAYDCDAEPVWEGWTHRTFEPSTVLSRWMQTVTAKWAILASLVAALAVPDAARHHFHDWFDTADVREVSSHNTINVIEGDPWNVPFQIQNTAREADASIVVQRASLRKREDNEWTTIDRNERIFPSLKSGLSETYVAQREASADPLVNSVVDPSGVYEVGINGTAHAGTLAATRHWQFTKLLRIWKPLGQGTPTIEPDSKNTKRVYMRFRVEVGQSYPDGIDCKVVVLDCTLVEVLVTMPLRHPPTIDPKYDNKDPPKTGVGTSTWQSQRIGPTRAYDVVLQLEHDPPLTLHEWEQRASQCQWFLNPVERKP